MVLGPVEIVDEVDSTNRVLLDRARAGAPHGSVLVARHQTAGRGRLDRTWESPPGASLLVSVLLRPALAPEDAPLLTVAAALAAVETCEALTGVRPATKWPNDVVVEDGEGTAKLAGLLAESLIDGGRLSAVIVGMGLNVNWAEAPPAGGTALNQLAGRTVDGDDVLQRWLAALDRRVDAAASPLERTSLLAEYRASSSTLGRQVDLDTGAGRVSGQAVEIGDDGRLVLDLDGVRTAFAVGDVTHVRPSSS